MDAEHDNFVAECYWPDVDDADLAALDARVARAIADLAGEHDVRYIGSLLLRDDEVVLCRFEGHVEDVREVSIRAEIPFERMLATAHSPWPLSANGGLE